MPRSDSHMIRESSPDGLGSFIVYNLDGVPWHDAPKPRRFHRHWVQTRGWVDLDCVERCACGALRLPRFGRGWMKR